MNVQQLENELWEAADQLRANSKLTAAEYAMPVLGLIFLRHADNRFKAYLPEIEADIPKQVPAAQREQLIRLGFQGKAAIYLPEAARFDRIASLPKGANVGELIDRAMDVIEADYDVLKGALPRGYPQSAIGDIHKRIGPEIARRRLQGMLAKLLDSGQIRIQGGRR
jgi:type I restriction enzyme M protein